MGKRIRLSQEEKSQIEAAKLNFRKNARYGDVHLKLDQPDSSGTGGNSDTAAVARSFFSAKKRRSVLDLFEGSSAEKEAIEKLLKMFSIILRVISSKEKQIDTDSFEQYCTEAYCLLAESFPWASIPTSIHRVLGHSAEKIRLNSDYGLGKFSEEGLEALHKLVRRFRERCARKISLEANLQDTFMHLWIRSDPTICSFARSLSCTHCKDDGHTKRSCPQLKEKILSDEDVTFESFFV